MALKNPFRRSTKPDSNMSQHATDHPASEQQHDAPSTEQQADIDTPTAEEHSSDNGTVATLQGELDALRTEHQALHDKHVRLFAEFDNFRKRTAKEKLELMQFAGENTLNAVLPVLDDLDRAVANNDRVNDIDAVKEGFKLIQQKLVHILTSQGLKAMPDAKGEAFDTDRHEAITKAPAPSDDLKGKVIDVVENGYTLHDKVIRYAKVVVGE
ncbi:MAG: nucleotide exchange factor GrpE [Flavobacteriales bacterium]|nr:nucleotide exchange factor GrpE [Flavobacteriales bacterium]